MLTKKEKELINKDFSYCFHSVDFKIPDKKLEVVSEHTDVNLKQSYTFRNRVTISKNDLGSYKNTFDKILDQINELVIQRITNETEKVKQRDNILSEEYAPLQTEKTQLEEEYYEINRIFTKVNNAKNALQKRLDGINDAIEILTKSEKMIKVEINLFEIYGTKDAAIVEKIDHIVDNLESRVDNIRENAMKEKQKIEMKLDLAFDTFSNTILEHKFPKKKDGSWWHYSMRYLKRRNSLIKHYKKERFIPSKLTNTATANRKLKKLLFDFEYYRMTGKSMSVNSTPIYVCEGAHIGVTPILTPETKKQMLNNTIQLNETQFNTLKTNLELSISGTSIDTFKIDECSYDLPSLANFKEFGNRLLKAYFLTPQKKTHDKSALILLLETPYSLWAITPILTKD